MDFFGRMGDLSMRQYCDLCVTAVLFNHSIVLPIPFRLFICFGFDRIDAR